MTVRRKSEVLGSGDALGVVVPRQTGAVGDTGSPLRRFARGLHWSARGRRGPWAMIGVWVIAAAFLLALIAYGLASRSPAWFHPVDSKSREARDLAQRLENRLITEAYRFRGEPRAGESGEPRQTGEFWMVRISEREATAWLGVKLPEWLLNREPAVKLPGSVTDLQAHFESGGSAWLAARVDATVASLATQFRVIGGDLWLSRVRAGVGSLTLPASLGGWGLWGGGSLAGEDGAWFWKVITGRVPLLKGSTIRLEDGRRVRVVDVRVGEGVMEVKCATEVP